MQTITVERLRQVLNCDPETGLLTWKVRMGQRGKQGEPAGCVNRVSGYRQVRLDGRLYQAHRLVWAHVHGDWPSGEIDHIDGTKHNNALSNLRDASHQLNKQNQRAAMQNSASGLLGAFRASEKRWRSEITVGGRRIHLGYYPTAEEAHAAYVGAKRVLHPGCTI